MKKITFLLALLLAGITESSGQVNNYSFSQSSGTYTSLTGDTVLASQTTASGTAATALDDVNYTIALPFAFNFSGVNYASGTNIYVNTNGFVSFGASAPATNTYVPISTTNVYDGAISAFGTDSNGGYAVTGSNTNGSPVLTITSGNASEFAVGSVVAGTGIPAGSTVVSTTATTITISANCTSTGTSRTFTNVAGRISYKVNGTAPNQSLVIQFTRMRPYNVSLATIDYQIVLNETTNVIDVIYGTAIGSATATTLQVGLRASTNANYNNRTSTTSWAATTAGLANNATITLNSTVSPASGLTFTWTPPVLCTGTPSSGSVAPVAQNVCNGAIPANLVCTGFTPGVSGLTFQWQESDDNGVGDAWTDVATGTGATTSVYTPPAFAGTTIYYRLNVTCTPSGQSAQTASVVVNPPNAPATQVTNLAQGTATLTTIPLNWVNGNGTRRVVYFNSVNSFTDPVNGNAPANTAAAAYAGGEQIVYDGTGTAVTVTGLTAGTTYYAKVYEYTRCGAGPYDFYYNVSVATNLLTVNTLSPPANDNFANAIAVTCGNTYNGTTATASLDEDDAPDGFGADMDAPNVWFSYTGSGTPQTVTLDLCGSAYDTSVLVYTGTSGALTLIGANDDEASCSAGGTRSKLNFTSDGTTTYYIAIEGWNAGNTGAFTMVTSCVSACTPAVANQTCATALSVSTNGVDVNSDNTCGDISPTQPSCDTFGTIQDVWFSFVGPANGVVDCVVTPLTMTSANFAIYSGADCNSLTLLTGTCNSDLTAATTEALTGLTPGQTYYIQVWSSTAEQGTFTLNLLSPACIIPSGIVGNNLTHNSVDLSWNATSGNYQYVLDNVATNPAGSGTDLAGEFYAASGLNVSTQYYFHLRTDCGSGSYSNWVTYSFTTLPTPPANNDCSGAVVLIPGGNFAAGEVTGTNAGATASQNADPTIPAPGCASYLGGDVWYSAVVPASGSLTFEVNESVGGLDDTGGAVYSGACNSLVLEGCNDSLSASGDHPLISLTGRTPGETLYFRVWEYGNTAIGNFRVSAYDASLSSDSFDLKGFKAYPNPVKDIFRISYVKEISSVAVYNLLGQEVLTQKVNALSSEINMTSLSKGTYLVKVTVDGLVNTVKVIKE
ncbi:T9SS type A sorting domain-containing protein [Flavobacterium sp. GCM10023249]|uniref:T9SS type A sorting domain-containing protein n=1 Tax=unclassified Flavobacterium TaxID=196869 RepID=UPI00360EA512